MRRPAKGTGSDGDQLSRVRPVRRVHEQVYDQLREAVVSGELEQGYRLPTELELAGRFGVSRNTVRQALSLLVSGGLASTTRGAAGGTFVTLPSAGRASEQLNRHIELLTHTDRVTLREFLEAREVLELFALRRVVEARSQADFDELRRTVPASGVGEDPAALGTPERTFHRVLVELCRNTLLQIAADSVYFVFSARLANSRATISRAIREQCRKQHGSILDAIVDGERDRAEGLMHNHLRGLAKVYTALWS